MTDLIFDSNGNVVSPIGVTRRKRVAEKEHSLQQWEGGIGGSWQPTGQALQDLIAQDAEDTTEAQQLRTLVATLRSGNATNAQVQRALARLITEVLKQ